VLPARHRMRASTDFSETVRRGRRASRATLTVHLLPGEPGQPAVPPRAGLVVSKAVGGSVVRHQVARRLRHQLQTQVSALPAGSRLVVRAQVPAGTASSAALGADLASALDTAVRKLARG
jgi:ribonuclease P protein component